MLKRLLFIAACVLGASQAHAQVGTGIGAQPVHYLSAASTNSTLVAAGWHTIFSLSAYNTTTTIYYLKLYNKATAPTCNTDVPVQTIPIPSSVTVGSISLDLGNVGLGFPAGIGFCITAGSADNDNTNAATGVTIDMGYK